MARSRSTRLGRSPRSRPTMPEALVCPGCATEIAPGLLSCPRCQRLVHAERLKELAAEAETAERRGEPSAALAAWRGALELLPAGSRQHDAIAAKIGELGRRVDGSPGAAEVRAESTSVPEA